MTPRNLVLSLLLFTCPRFALAAEAPGALPPDKLLEALDQHMVFKSRMARTKMAIHKEGKVTEKELVMRSRGYETAFTEFVAPPRDKGTRYLKLEKNLWMWLPGAEKQVKISGHMLRQSLMGSDFSYEDMLESPDMAGRYDAEEAGTDTVDGRPCRVLMLKAKAAGVTYPKRKVWVDAEKHVPLKQELFALTDKPMKLQTFHDFKEFPEGDRVRYYPTRLVMKNLLQKETETEIKLDELQFGVEFPDDVFTLGNLEKGK